MEICAANWNDGRMTTDARVPRVEGTAPRQVAEAVRIGPYLMPPFSEKTLNQHEVNSIARYLRYWLMRLVYEERSSTDRIVEALDRDR